MKRALLLLAFLLPTAAGAQSEILDEIRAGDGVRFEVVAQGMQTLIALRSPDCGKTVLGEVYIGKVDEGKSMLCSGTIKGEQVHLYPIEKPDLGELFYIAFGDYEARLYLEGADNVIVVPKKKVAQ